MRFVFRISDDKEFLQLARSVYIRANQDAMQWQLNRMCASCPLINTKLNSITLKNYSPQDGLRSEEFVYGWIQGRGLEAMVTQAAWFANFNTDMAKAKLARRLENKAVELYPLLRILFRSGQGAYFCYNKHFHPVCCSDPEGSTRQQRDPGIATYSDIFVIKGLIAAASQFVPEDLSEHLSALETVINAIDNNQFLIAESNHITQSALAQQLPDFGPKMIALSAASLLRRVHLNKMDTFSTRFINDVIDEHLDRKSGLIATIPRGKQCNIGHSIEFAGLALETIRGKPASDLGKLLCEIIDVAFNTGFNGTGLLLTVDIPTRVATSDICPWWSLPECIRAASLGYELTGSGKMLEIWKTAHAAFFRNYWRYTPPVAYQALSNVGPVDIVPATPDLDPGYHTGLGLLCAIEATDRYSHKHPTA
jgi:hypothetical protein